MKIKPVCNIIFDLGGVILNINPRLTVEAFRNLGWSEIYDVHNQLHNKDLFCSLESGNSSTEIFRENVRQVIPNPVTDNQIDKAWTAMILDIPADRVRYLEELKKSYRLFLLSNTNEIHRKKFHHNFKADFGYSLYDLFEQSFYSHKMGMRKPNPQIFFKVLQETGLVPEETLFIDDMEENIEAARTTGMKVLHIQPGTLLERLPAYLNDNHPLGV